MEKPGLGMRMSVVSVAVLWGKREIYNSLLLPGYFLVAMLMGLMQWIGKGDLVSGPVIKQFVNFWPLCQAQ